ncbi:MAG: hypothetical protein LBB45_09155 [Methanobrevibacter sp.]|jgi:hypothetical protein|nr:hypothetical protein [Candidatus Methanovirga basalitermitum]
MLKNKLILSISIIAILIIRSISNVSAYNHEDIHTGEIGVLSDSGVSQFLSLTNDPNKPVREGRFNHGDYGLYCYRDKNDPRSYYPINKDAKNMKWVAEAELTWNADLNKHDFMSFWMEGCCGYDTNHWKFTDVDWGEGVFIAMDTHAGFGTGSIWADVYYFSASTGLDIHEQKVYDY